MRKIIILIFIVSLVFGAEMVSAQGKSTNPPGSPKDIKIQFRVKWDGRIVPGITQVSALRRKTELLEHRSGGDPSLMRRSPGKSEYTPIVLKRPRSTECRNGLQKPPHGRHWAVDFLKAAAERRIKAN